MAHKGLIIWAMPTAKKLSDSRDERRSGASCLIEYWRQHAPELICWDVANRPSDYKRLEKVECFDHLLSIKLARVIGIEYSKEKRVRDSNLQSPNAIQAMRDGGVGFATGIDESRIELTVSMEVR